MSGSKTSEEIPHRLWRCGQRRWKMSACALIVLRWTGLFLCVSYHYCFTMERQDTH